MINVLLEILELQVSPIVFYSNFIKTYIFKKQSIL